MDKVAVIYWSGTGNTEMMAKYIADGVKAAGGQADVFSVSDFSQNQLAEYGRYALGCPAKSPFSALTAGVAANG